MFLVHKYQLVQNSVVTYNSNSNTIFAKTAYIIENTRLRLLLMYRHCLFRYCCIYFLYIHTCKHQLVQNLVIAYNHDPNTILAKAYIIENTRLRLNVSSF